MDMLEAGYQPVGIDLSPYMTRLTSRRLRRKNLALRLSQARAQALPFPSNYFANVVATFPTDYMLASETIAEIQRVLKKPAGRLVVVAEGQLQGPWPLRPLVDWLYDITSQHSLPPTRPLALLTAYDFEARWEMVERQGAAARLLIADKK
jgi:ubiquinone/menaquinone biosynthesis C-methylase UbiE